MADSPIIFSGPMVRALLDGRKTMTRRLAWSSKWICACGWKGKPEQLKPTPAGGLACPICGGTGGLAHRFVPTPWQDRRPGDRLWVREGYCPRSNSKLLIEQVQKPFYMATDGEGDMNKPAAWRWRPSIHMPRWPSRLTLVVTATKIERLQGISEADAIAEGIERDCSDGCCWKEYGKEPEGTVFDPRESFASLWRSLHGPESWDANPEVVAISFTVHKVNIGQMKEPA